jgi:hypothetical protein
MVNRNDNVDQKEIDAYDGCYFNDISDISGCGVVGVACSVQMPKTQIPHGCLRCDDVLDAIGLHNTVLAKSGKVLKPLIIIIILLNIYI